MTSTPNYRMERIERLLDELRYEVTRGMVEGEIDETLHFRFVVPVSKRIPRGVVACQLSTRPMLDAPWAYAVEPRLKVVK